MDSIPGATLPVALTMAEKGLRLFPVHLVRDGEKWNKRPLTPNGHKDASSDVDRLRSWSKDFPDCRWGVVAQEFVALDLDSTTALERAKRLGLPPDASLVPTARKGAHHVYFRSFQGAGSWAGRISNIDSRGGGTGWVVLYAPFDPATLPPAPEWFVAVSRWGEPRPFPEGTHDVTLARIAGRLWNEPEATEDVVLERLKAIGTAQAEGRYTYSDKDLLRIVRSIGKKHHRSHPERNSAPVHVVMGSTGKQSPSPWEGREGWAHEREIPIVTEPVRNRGTGETEEKPVEPAYQIYNRFITEHYFRPFRTKNGEARVAIPTKHGLKVLDPSAEDFPDAIGYLYFTLLGDAVPQRELKKVAVAIKGRALDLDLPDPRVVELSIRVAPRDGIGCRLDMRDREQRCIAVGPNGWKIETLGHPVFDARGHMLPLPEPVRPSDINNALEDLWRFVLLPRPSQEEGRQGENQRLLFISALVTILLFPSSSKPVVVFLARESAGKSSSAFYSQSCLDPSVLSNVRPPEKKEDDDYLRTLVLNHATLNFDNVSYIDPVFSDNVCRLATGSGIVTRQLFTTRDELVLNAKPWILINGITATPRAPDLLRRSLLLDVAGPEELGLERLADSELAARWAAAHPGILGALLELAVRTAKILTTDPPTGRRDSMQEYVRVGQAVATALGLTADDFLRAFDQNTTRQGQSAMEDPLTGALLAYWRERPPGSLPVSAEEIQKALLWNCKETFPKGLTTLQVGHALNRVRRTFETVGIYLENRFANGTRKWFRVTIAPPTVKSTAPTAPLESFLGEKSIGAVEVPSGAVGCRREDGETHVPVETKVPSNSTAPEILTTAPEGPSAEKSPPGAVGAVGAVVSLIGKSREELHAVDPPQTPETPLEKGVLRPGCLNVACGKCPKCAQPDHQEKDCQCGICSPWGSGTGIHQGTHFTVHYCGPKPESMAPTAALLDTLRACREGATPADLSEKLGIGANAALRALVELERLNAAYRDSNGNWRAL